MVSFTLRPTLSSGKEPWYWLCMKLSEPHISCGQFKGENMLPLPGNGHQVSVVRPIAPVTKSTDLPRLIHMKTNKYGALVDLTSATSSTKKSYMYWPEIWTQASANCLNYVTAPFYAPACTNLTSTSNLLLFLCDVKRSRLKLPWLV
jgi:hypothetical protein